MEYPTLNADRGSIVVMRVENGWLIRTDDKTTLNSTPLRVAETPQELLRIIEGWAVAQAAKRAAEEASA